MDLKKLTMRRTINPITARRAHGCAVWRSRSPERWSTSRFYRLGDLLGCCENHRSPVAHHSGRHDRGCTFLRSILAGVGLKAQIAFPERAGLAVGCGNSLGVAAIGDSFDLNARFKLFKIRVGTATHHSSHALAFQRARRFRGPSRRALRTIRSDTAIFATRESNSRGQPDGCRGWPPSAARRMAAIGPNAKSGGL
jgi:hypothetical protein